MKKIMLKLIIAVIAVGLVAAAASSIGRRLDGLTQSVSEITAAKPVIYTLSDYNGRLAIYKNAEAEPIEVFDIFSSSLPEAEYQRIITGVSAENEEELQKLIEAYTS